MSSKRRLIPFALLFAGGSVMVLGGGCNVVLGLGSFKDCCPPLGNGDRATCVDCSATGGGKSTSSSSSAGGAIGTGGSGGQGECTPGKVEDCYDGMPASTEGVGQCKHGQHTCDQSGHFGACEGEVVPKPETCSSPKDEDCDGFDCILWDELIEASSSQEFHAIATDANGNAFLVGDFVGSITVAGQQHVSVAYIAGHNNTTDLILVKVDPSGKQLWAKTYGDAGQQRGQAVAVDAMGNVYVGGAYYANSGNTNTFSLGGGTEVGSGMFVAKYTNDGDYIWSTSLGGLCLYPGETGAEISSMAVTPDGGVVVGGSFWGDIDFGHGPVTAVSHPSAFLGVLKNDGTVGTGSWPITSGDVAGSAQYVTGVGATSNGDLVAAGYFTGQLTLGFPAVNASAGNMFVAVYAADGSTFFRKNLGTGQITNLAVMPVGDFVVGGNFTGDLTWGSTSVTASANGSAFVMKVNNGEAGGGNAIWALGFGDTAGITGLDTGTGGDIHLSAFFKGSTTIAGTAVDPGAGDNAVIAKLTPSGALTWYRGFAPHPTFHLTVDAQDDTLVTGVMSNPSDLGTGKLMPTAAGGYVAKFAP